MCSRGNCHDARVDQHLRPRLDARGEGGRLQRHRIVRRLYLCLRRLHRHARVFKLLHTEDCALQHHHQHRRRVVRANGLLEFSGVRRVRQHDVEVVHTVDAVAVDCDEDGVRVDAAGDGRVVVDHELQQVREGWRHACRLFGSASESSSSWTQRGLASRGSARVGNRK